MVMMKRAIAVWYYVILEVNVGMIMLFFWFIGKNEQLPIFPIFSSGLAAIVLYTLLLNRFANNGKWLYLFTILPATIITGQLAGIPFFISIVLSLYIFWRGSAISEDPTRSSETWMLFWSIIIGLIAIIVSGASHYPYQPYLIVFLIGQLLLVLTGSYFMKWTSLSMDRTRFAGYFLKIIAGLSAVAALLAFLLKYFEIVFFGIMKLLALVFSVVSGPILTYSQYILSLNTSGDDQPALKESEMVWDELNYQPKSFESTAQIVYVVLFLGVLVLIFLVLKKKLRPVQIAGKTTPGFEILEVGVNRGGSIFRRKKTKQPENAIRKEIFHFEKLAHKLKLGRYPNESLDEWLQRMDLAAPDDLIRIYEKVRYGEMNASPAEEDLIKSEIFKLKEQLKKIHKNKNL